MGNNEALKAKNPELMLEDQKWLAWDGSEMSYLTWNVSDRRMIKL